MDGLFKFGPGEELNLSTSPVVQNRCGTYSQWTSRNKLIVQLAVNAVLELKDTENGKSEVPWKVRHTDHDTFWTVQEVNGGWDRVQTTVEFTCDIFDLVWHNRPVLSIRETVDGYILLELDHSGLNECIDDVCEAALKHANRFRN